jgi:hypothetical protein
MSPELLEFVARERYQALLQDAEKKRLYKMLPSQESNTTKAAEWMKCWLGIHMVALGLKLQGANIAALPQLTKSEPTNC